VRVELTAHNRILYEFHKSQNAKRPSSIHATYLVYGVKTPEKAQEDGDVEMTSSAPDPDAHNESAPDVVMAYTLTVVPEEELACTKACLSTKVSPLSDL